MVAASEVERSLEFRAAVRSGEAGVCPSGGAPKARGKLQEALFAARAPGATMSWASDRRFVRRMQKPGIDIAVVRETRVKRRCDMAPIVLFRPGDRSGGGHARRVARPSNRAGRMTRAPPFLKEVSAALSKLDTATHDDLLHMLQHVWMDEELEAGVARALVVSNYMRGDPHDAAHNLDQHVV